MCAEGKASETERVVIKNVSYAVCDKCRKPIKGSGVSMPGVACWILKDYVKKGQRVPFCDNWARLCEAVGFRVVQRVRCWLVKEENNPGLFGTVTKRTERKSFFRRLHERKPGAVRIDWEEVLFVVKP